MQFGKIYQDVTKGPSRDEDEPTQTVAKNNESEARAQAKFNWKSSTVTQEMVQSFQAEASDLMAKTIALAVNYPTTGNHQQIIQNLVRINELSKVVETLTK